MVCKLQEVKKVTVFTSASKIITLDKMSLDDAVVFNYSSQKVLL